MKKLLTLFTLLLTVCSGAWADDTYYLQTPGAATPALTGDFYTTATLSQSQNCTYNDVNYTKAIKFNGNVNQWSSMQYTDRMVRYDCKTDWTEFTVVVYNNNGNDKVFYVGDVQESTIGSACTPSPTSNLKSVETTKDAVTTTTYTIKNTESPKAASFFVTTGGNNNVFLVQIIAVEKGNPLPTPGTAGYSVNFNKGRMVCVVSSGKGSTYIDDSGFEFNLNSTYKAGNSAYAQLGTNNTNYIKFTVATPMVLNFTTANNKKYTVSKTKGDTENKITPTANTAQKINLTSAGTYYINPQESSVQATGLSFSAAPVVTYDANGGSGSMSTTYFTVAANSFTAPTGKEFKEWNDDEGGNGTSYEVGDEIETSTTLYAIWQDAVADEAPTISIDSSADAAVDKGTEVTLTATITGHPTPTVQWYSNTVNNNTSGTVIDGATETTYSPSTTTGGTMYYYAKATNNFGGEDHVATSNVVSVVVNKSTACELTKVSYSNGFDAFIKLGDTNTITAYYIAGKDVPTINGVTISDYATYEVEGSTLTVTAEDGTTTKEFTITLSPVTPYSGTGTHDFDGTETWVKNVYGYSAADGWKISKPVEDINNKRVSEGKCRMYFFMAPHTSLKMKNITNTRNVDVYKDGVKLETVEFTENTEKTMTIDADDACMIGFVNKGNGDAKFKYVTITKTGFESGIITASGWNTFSSSSNLDLSQVTGGTAFVATTTSGSNVTLAPVEDKIVTAGTGLMIKGNANEAFKIATTTSEATYSGDNLLVGLPTGGTVEVAGSGYNNYVFGWTDASNPGFYKIESDTPTLGAGKAYLHTTSALGSKLGLIFDDGETTNIKLNVNDSLDSDAAMYNLAGQKVSNSYKGIVIVNGKKYVCK